MFCDDVSGSRPFSFLENLESLEVECQVSFMMMVVCCAKQDTENIHLPFIYQLSLAGADPNRADKDGITPAGTQYGHCMCMGDSSRLQSMYINVLNHVHDIVGLCLKRRLNRLLAALLQVGATSPCSLSELNLITSTQTASNPTRLKPLKTVWVCTL